jgi:mRNA-degrading endonuclease RelE of RelBE toxin-antitoxin system
MNYEMVYEIVATEDFERQLRRLEKKYSSIPSDYAKFLEELLKNPEIGRRLGGNARKVRMAITSKGKGKRGGARVITCNVLINIENMDIYLLTIYDKGDQDSISNKEIETLKSRNGL